MKAPINTKNMQPEHFLLDAMTMGTSNAIEMQESQGQHSFVKSDTLPTDGMVKYKQVLESFGVKIGNQVDGDQMFTYVELPAGWAKRATDHSMHSDLLDEKGRKRAGIFYKAAFYDRSAHFYCATRFSICKDYDVKTASACYVLDGEKKVFVTEPLQHLEGNDRETHLKNYAMDDKASETAEKWLAEKYPDWKNPAAYWNE